MTEETNSIRPDDVIPPQGESIQGRQMALDAVLMIPNLVKLVGRLLKDPRVPRRAKVVLGFAAAYVASPIDLIPEFIPVIGWADDLLILVFALDSLIERAGKDVVEEHWDGPGDLLGLIR
ncbi:MAG: YkvA family protein, partial [Actinomycetota bacterium]|nr:YkvA family protein [Actinomycetota bacterium]